MSSGLLTIGEIAARLGVKRWQVRALFTRSILSEPSRIGAYRVIAERDLPVVEQALREAGYLPKVEARVEA
jgi:DNA-binding transcriptional MerR regulator